jgi:thiamine biosynthesis protein ThiS
MALVVELNGQSRSFSGLEDSAFLGTILADLGLHADRVAVEHNGQIVTRSRWPDQLVHSGDKLEVVHFVGGGNIDAARTDAVAGETLKLEPIVEADYPAVVELANVAYRGHDGWATEADVMSGTRLSLASLVADLHAKPQAHLLLVRGESEAEVRGTVWLEPQESGTWYLGLLTVRPALQNRQLGRAVLTAAEDFARNRGALTIRMTVLSARQTLIEWYERRGYHRTGATVPCACQGSAGTPLRDGLFFLILEKVL